MTTADLQRAAQALARARERIVALERARAEPVALVGVGLRLPGGVDSTDALWSVLAERRDLTTAVPDDRRAALAGIDAGGPGASRGAWIAGVEQFDAERFGVPAREAEAMDPQQRLLLEVSLAAIERAGLRDDELRGSRTGVYVGICNNDYAQRFLRDPTDPRIDATLGTGNCCSMAAGRIAYAFGLTGPAFALDAACASSLLAVHLAVQAIRGGECERALVGGVNLVLSPNPSLAFARMGVLSPAGRCRAMDAAADGYLRAEGCVILVLEPLAAAQAAGRPILAVIRGSAVRQNGTGNGLVAPNPGAQVEVIRAAQRDAAVTPDDVGMIAAFAGGTPLGDLAEVTALERIFKDRDERRPLWLGLCKPNLGHSEGASGATSLLLACEAIARASVPPTLLAGGPSPRLPWAATRLADRPIAWHDVDRVAGVSAFGFNGTNVHVILGAPPPSSAAVVDTPRKISLSARSEPLLRTWAGALADHLRAHPELPHAAVVATLTRGRTREPIAAELAADDPATLLAALDRLAAGDPFTPTDVASHAQGPMVPLPPRPLARRRYWAELRAADDRPAPSSLPDVALLQAAPRSIRQAAITRALVRFFASALRRELAADDDLGGAGVDSLLAVDLLARVRQDWGLVVFPGELFARRTAAGLAEHFAALLERPDVTAAATHVEIRRAVADGHRRGRPSPATDEPPADASLAPPVFLLSTPRSGSTLLRALLGAHPALFAPPELHLLAYADVADWRDALAPDLLHLGLHQALAGLGLTDDQLLAQVASWADARAPIAAVYDFLRAHAAPRRLIDKSPSYALDPATLARAARLFPRARYIHLVRHPVPTCRSFVERRMGRLLGLDGFDAAAAAAQVWALGNHHLLEFLAARPPDHVLQVRYEALVRDPAAELVRICKFLDLEFTPAMLDPHAHRFPGEDRGVIGDPGFYARRGIDAGLADEWRARVADDALPPEAHALAARLGYALDGPAPAELAAIRLDPAIVVNPRRPRRPPARLLLTGATGFLGPWLIRALRARGPAEVIALVRARDDAEAARRLHAALAAIPGADPTGVRAIAGHLDRPRLGLDETTWAELTASVDLVVHNGAEVNFTRTWQQLAASNIGGTAEALRLACAGRAGFVHVSTKGVYDPAVYPGDAEIHEDDRVRAPEGPLLGYQRSKWAAEALVREAGARGLPVAVARPGRIGGDLATGVVPETDFMVVFLRGCAEIAALPDLAYAIEVSPVDVVAAAIAGLCAHDDPFGRAYHLTHPAPIDLRSVAAIAGEFGVRLDVLPYPAWRERLLVRAGGPGSALAPLLSMFPAHEPPRIDDRRLAHRNLAAVVPDVAWPPMPALLRTSLAFMRGRGLL